MSKHNNSASENMSFTLTSEIRRCRFANIPELPQLIYCVNYDIISVTETWLRVAIDSATPLHSTNGGSSGV